MIPHGTQTQIENACLNKSTTLWPFVTVFRLTVNVRVRRSPSSSQYSQFLLRVGEGREPTVAVGQHNDFIRLPEIMAFSNLEHGNSAAALVRAIYPNMQGRHRDLEYLSERAILAPRNDDVDLLNSVASDAFPGAFVELLSQDFIDDEETQAATLYPTEFLNSINPPSLPPHRLLLKEAQPILLLYYFGPEIRTLQRNTTNL